MAWQGRNWWISLKTGGRLWNLKPPPWHFQELYIYKFQISSQISKIIHSNLFDSTEERNWQTDRAGTSESVTGEQTGLGPNKETGKQTELGPVKVSLGNRQGWDQTKRLANRQSWDQWKCHWGTDRAGPDWTTDKGWDQWKRHWETDKGWDQTKRLENRQSWDQWKCHWGTDRAGTKQRDWQTDRAGTSESVTGEQTGLDQIGKQTRAGTSESHWETDKGWDQTKRLANRQSWDQWKCHWGTDRAGPDWTTDKGWDQNNDRQNWDQCKSHWRNRQCWHQHTDTQCHLSHRQRLRTSGKRADRLNFCKLNTCRSPGKSENPQVNGINFLELITWEALAISLTWIFSHFSNNYM